MNTNSLEDFNIPKPVKLIALYFALFVFGVLFLLGYFGFYQHSDRNRVLSKEYTGKVVKLYNDTQNHNAYTARLSNGRTILVDFPLEKDNPVLELNDSIVKQKNSVYILVFKDGKFHRTLNTLYRQD